MLPLSDGNGSAFPPHTGHRPSRCEASEFSGSILLLFVPDELQVDIGTLTVKLGDFGASKLLATGTLPHTVTGSLVYMAPGWPLCDFSF